MGLAGCAPKTTVSTTKPAPVSSHVLETRIQDALEAKYPKFAKEITFEINRPVNSTGDGTEIDLLVLHIPRDKYFSNSKLTGSITLDGEFDPGFLYQTPGIKTASMPPDHIFIQPKGITDAYRTALANLETEAPLNLEADLSLGLAQTGGSKAKSLLVGKIQLLRTRLRIKANEPEMAVQTLNAARKAAVAHPELKPDFNDLQKELSNLPRPPKGLLPAIT